MLTQELGNKIYPKGYIYCAAFLVGLTFIQGFWKEISQSDIVFTQNDHLQNIDNSLMSSTVYSPNYAPSGRKPSRNTDEATFAKPHYPPIINPGLQVTIT